MVKIDIATMAYSLEARSPLLDPEVMEFAASLAPSLKLHRMRKKWIFRQAYRHVIPREILSGAKIGFSTRSRRGCEESSVITRARYSSIRAAWGGGIFKKAR